MGKQATPAAGENRLLAALPKEDFDRITARMRDVVLDYGDVVYRPLGEIRHVYFPRSGVLSTVITTNEGGIIEVATVGAEGFAGIPLLLATDRSPAKVYCQIPPCPCRGLDADAFREEVARGGPFGKLLRHYTQHLINQMAQSVACARLHSVEERMSRWLLMTHDRVGADEFMLTHEVLAQMLGVQRVSVTLTAGILQRAGLIQYRRGRIRLLDRAGLEEASCECYRVVRAELERLLPASPGPGG